MSKVQNKESNNDIPVIAPEKKEQEFLVEELLENSKQIFGYYPEVLSAALFGRKVEKLSIPAAKKYINDFLKKEVK